MRWSSESSTSSSLRQMASSLGCLFSRKQTRAFSSITWRFHPRKKGQGIGKALLVHAEQEAVARGYGSVYLYTNDRMTENIAMYTKAGYVEYERRQELGFRRVFLRKSLL